jgi:hypothetical protein
MRHNPGIEKVALSLEGEGAGSLPQPGLPLSWEAVAVVEKGLFTPLEIPPLPPTPHPAGGLASALPELPSTWQAPLRLHTGHN